MAAFAHERQLLNQGDVVVVECDTNAVFDY
jgi:hypothetical protein